MSDLCLNVTPKAIQIIWKSINAFMNQWPSNEESDRDISELDDDHSELWKPKPYDSKTLWFLKENESTCAVEALDSISSATNR